tara:strand:- start:486 stop:653 length:168 start_codon:yes stop_codon:yes gene_type:complete
MYAKAQAISINNLTLQKGSPVTIPLSRVSDDLKALEKAGEIRIIVRGKQAMLVKL